MGVVKIKSRLKCKFCDSYHNDVDAYVAHLESKHHDIIPENMDPWQFYYFLKTGKRGGRCIMCNNPTKWNSVTHKYFRFCDNPKCKDRYREEFKKRMIGKYGKVSLLDDPEQQKKMLANRSISGEYMWSTSQGTKTYTGSYEHDFLEFLDKFMQFEYDDVMSPSPHTYWYTYNNEKHFYIPDFFIPSLGLEVEVKDGGDNPNMHHKIQAVDKVKEKLKDQVMVTNKAYHYIKIINKNNRTFLDFLERVKYNTECGREDEKVYILQ